MRPNFNPEKIVGTALMRTTLKKIVDLDAPSVLDSVSQSGSTLLAPAIVLLSTIKNVSENPRATLDAIPRPNQRRNSGASATRGSAFRPARMGSRNRSLHG